MLKSLMNKIRNKLRVWLGVEENKNGVEKLERLREISSKKTDIVFSNSVKNRDKIRLLSDDIYKTQMQLESISKSFDNVYKTVESVVSIGADVAEQPYNSWAVVCIEGKMNTVKFVDLGHRNALEILDYLKQFQVGRKVIDVPPYLNRVFTEDFR